MSKTEIQRVIDFLRQVLPDETVIQAYTLDTPWPPMDIPRDEVIGVQLVTSAPVAGTPWAHVIAYTPHLDTNPPTATLVMGHNYKTSIKFHCLSYLSFDKADVLADLIINAFHDYSTYINRDRPAVMKSHGIIRVVDGPRKTPTLPSQEPETWKLVVDTDLEIQRTETYTVTPITKWQNLNAVVNGFLEKIIYGKDRFAHPDSGKAVFIENDPEVDSESPPPP